MTFNTELVKVLNLKHNRGLEYLELADMLKSDKYTYKLNTLDNDNGLIVVIYQLDGSITTNVYHFNMSIDDYVLSVKLAQRVIKKGTK